MDAVKCWPQSSCGQQQSLLCMQNSAELWRFLLACRSLLEQTKAASSFIKNWAELNVCVVTWQPGPVFEGIPPHSGRYAFTSHCLGGGDKQSGSLRTCCPCASAFNKLYSLWGTQEYQLFWPSSLANYFKWVMQSARSCQDELKLICNKV